MKFLFLVSAPVLLAVFIDTCGLQIVLRCTQNVISQSNHKVIIFVLFWVHYYEFHTDSCFT